RDGDRAALRRLYDSYLDYVRRHVGRLLGPDGPVDDVVQEVFVEVFSSIAEFRGDSSFKTWLYRITRNVAISRLRKRRPKQVDLSALDPLRSATDTREELEARDQVKALYAVLDQVKPESREAFLLHEVEGWKLREIAEKTDTSINTIGSRVRRTRKRLRKYLEACMPEATDE
ncbi:MAG: RNA polymerase sigma factor, partial [Bradymonadaceae bacterium]